MSAPTVSPKRAADPIFPLESVYALGETRITHRSGSAITLANEVNWPLLRLVVNAADVFTNHADTDELDSTYEQHCRKQRRITGYRIAEQQRAHDHEPAV
jgi:hypothetical protein